MIAQATAIALLEEPPVVITSLPGFITEVEVEHAIKAGAFTGDVAMNSIEIGLHVDWIGDLIGIAAALPPCFPQDEWGVLQSEGVEGVAKQRFIGY